MLLTSAFQKYRECAPQPQLTTEQAVLEAAGYPKCVVAVQQGGAAQGLDQLHMKIRTALESTTSEQLNSNGDGCHAGESPHGEFITMDVPAASWITGATCGSPMHSTSDPWFTFFRHDPRTARYELFSHGVILFNAAARGTEVLRVNRLPSIADIKQLPWIMQSPLYATFT